MDFETLLIQDLFIPVVEFDGEEVEAGRGVGRFFVMIDGFQKGGASLLDHIVVLDIAILVSIGTVLVKVEERSELLGRVGLVDLYSSTKSFFLFSFLFLVDSSAHSLQESRY